MSGEVIYRDPAHGVDAHEPELEIRNGIVTCPETEDHFGSTFLIREVSAVAVGWANDDDDDQTEATLIVLRGGFVLRTEARWYLDIANELRRERQKHLQSPAGRSQ